MGDTRPVRIRVLIGVAAVVVGVLATPVFVLAAGPAGAAGDVVAQSQERPTRSQPPAGEHITRPAEDRPWSYNWVARPLIAIVALFFVALGLGYVVRWVGLGRRTA